ncbi:MAG: helix-turn-helix transcriptional regulator [bacterium]|nr:helix-turn-helix transcriptional regulator [bacterium]
MKDNCENLLQAFLERKFAEARAGSIRLTRKAFAERLGISREHFSGLLSGKKPRQPRIETCCKMAKYFRMSLERFLSETGLLPPDYVLDSSSTSLAAEDSAEYGSRLFLANVPEEMQNLCQELCKVLITNWRSQDRKLKETEGMGK